MNSPKQILTLSAISIGYGEKSLVSDISVGADTGTFVLLVGANGKGKSTLLKTIAGYLAPLKGIVQLDGRSLNELSKNELSRLISYLPGRLHVPIEVTVSDLLEYARIPYLKGMRSISQDDMQVIERTVDELEIRHLTGSRYNELSDGQRQLVNIARALVQETNVIILDEPTANLDLVNKRKVFQLLASQSEKGKLIICCTHDFMEASSYCSDLWMINKDNAFEYFKIGEFEGIEQIEKSLF